MESVRCPACGGSAFQVLAPGFYECQATVMVSTGRPPSGAAGPPTVPQTCGNRFAVAVPDTTSPPCHACGVFSIGLCHDCHRPTCGFCGRHDGMFRCRGCISSGQARAADAVAQQKAVAADRRAERRLVLADLLEQWIEAPSIPPGKIVHVIDTGSAKGPKACPLGHLGCERAKARRDRGYGGMTTNYYVTAGWPLADLLETEPTRYHWPPEGAGRWERQFPYRGHEQITVHGELLGSFSVAARTTGMEERFYAQAREAEGTIERLRAGFEAPAFFQGRAGRDVLSSLTEALRRLV